MDWKNLLVLLGCANILVTIASFISIKFNDLRHLEKDVAGINKNV